MIDLTKKVQTKNGLPVRILCTDRKGSFPVCGLVSDIYGEELYGWQADGSRRGWGGGPYDLINIPEKHEAWVNIYADLKGPFHPNRGLADTGASVGRLACVRVEWVDGEGLG